MRVRIVQHGGYANAAGLKLDRGETADLPDALAVKLVNYGIAKPAPAPVETVAKAAPRNAARRVGKIAPRKGAK